MAKAKAPQRRNIRCYLCGHRSEVSLRTMSTTCPKCNRAIKVEDVTVKTYLPVNDLQTCGTITITAKGRVVAKRVQCGGDLICEGVIEGAIEAEGQVTLGPKSSWKGQSLQSSALTIADGAKLLGDVIVPWHRPDPETDVSPARNGSSARS